MQYNASIEELPIIRLYFRFSLSGKNVENQEDKLVVAEFWILKWDVQVIRYAVMSTLWTAIPIERKFFDMEKTRKAKLFLFVCLVSFGAYLNKGLTMCKKENKDLITGDSQRSNSEWKSEVSQRDIKVTCVKMLLNLLLRLLCIKQWILGSLHQHYLGTFRGHTSHLLFILSLGMEVMLIELG